MNTLRYIIHIITLMVVMCLVYACSDEEYISNADATFLKIDIRHIDARSIIDGEYIPDESQIGITVLDEKTMLAYEGTNYFNIYAEATGSGMNQTWSLQKELPLFDRKAKAVAYYPYSSTVTSYKAIPIAAGDIDYMYSGWVTGLNAHNNTALFIMKHALSAIKIYLRKENYTGEGVMKRLSIRSPGLGTAGVLNAETGTLSYITGQETLTELDVSGSVTEEGWSWQWMGVPTGIGNWIEIIIAVDGREYRKIITLDEPFQQGSKTVFNFVLSDIY